MLTREQYTLLMERHKKALGDALFLILVTLVLACGHHAWRGQVPLFVVPPNPAYEGLKLADSRDLARLNKQPGVIIVDARPSEAYRRERIPGSVSLPLHSNPSPELLQKLKEAKLAVLYCDGPKCDASKQLALRLQAEGITALEVFEGGLESWKAHGLAVEGDGLK